MKRARDKRSNPGLRQSGVLSKVELACCAGVPDGARLQRGPVAVIECAEEIPCDPCEANCPRGAIHVGKVITDQPVLDGDSCLGCGLCIAKCPGLAIFVVDESGEGLDKVSIPYEFLPLPETGQIVTGLSRDGKPVCEARVVGKSNASSNDRTPIVTLEVPKGFGMQVRFFYLKEGRVNGHRRG